MSNSPKENDVKAFKGNQKSTLLTSRNYCDGTLEKLFSHKIPQDALLDKVRGR